MTEVVIQCWFTGALIGSVLTNAVSGRFRTAFIVSGAAIVCVAIDVHRYLP